MAPAAEVKPTKKKPGAKRRLVSKGQDHTDDRSDNERFCLAPSCNLTIR